MRYRLIWPAAALSAGAALALGCGAGQARDPALSQVQQGQLRLSDGRQRVASLAELLPQARATVLLFWAAGCPCVRRYQARSDELLARWQPRGVQVLGIASNADETLHDVEKARRERGFALPVWRDRGGLLAQALGVQSTPTVVVLLPDGRVAYRGWIDNERLPGDPERQAWLDEALTRIAAGDLARTAKPSWGCRITRGTPEDAAPASAGTATATGTAEAPSGCGCKVATAAAGVTPTEP